MTSAIAITRVKRRPTGSASLVVSARERQTRSATANQANATTGSTHSSTLRHGMCRMAIALVFAVFLTAPLASAQKANGITPDSIVGIKLSITKPKATALLSKPVRFDRLEDGYERLVSGKQKVEVYFRKGAKGVVVVTTWNRTLKTQKGIGPCSSVAALKGAYGKQLQPFRQGGKLIAYRLGSLVFTTEGGKRVGVVAIGRGTAATYVALNAPECV